MWRRIPIVPMLFGACAALAMLTIFGIREPLLEGWRPYVAVAALGAAYVLVVYSIPTWMRTPRSTFDNIGCGCFYAAAGFLFLAVIGLVGSVSFSFTPCAAPEPVLNTVIVNPIGLPTFTCAASAVFTM